MSRLRRNFSQSSATVSGYSSGDGLRVVVGGGDAVPPDVQQIAEWVASAEYLERSFAKQNPDGADLELPDALMTKADKWAQRSRRRGWVLSPTGERIWTRSGTRSSMNVEATR